MTVDDLQARRSEGAAEVACPPGPRILLGRGHRPVTAGYVPAESGGMLTQTYPARQRTAGPVLWALTCGITGLVANVLLMLDQLTENVGDIRQYFMSPAVIAWGDGCSVCARGVVSGGPAIAAAGLLFPAGSAAWLALSYPAASFSLSAGWPFRCGHWFWPAASSTSPHRTSPARKARHENRVQGPRIPGGRGGCCPGEGHGLGDCRARQVGRQRRNV